MTTAERSETPRTNALLERHIAEIAEQQSVIGNRVLASNLPLKQVKEVLEHARELERELAALCRNWKAQGEVLEHLFERFPDCACMGDLPGCVDELRLRYTWKPMKDAPRNREVLFRWPAPLPGIEAGEYADCADADGWMEIP